MRKYYLLLIVLICWNNIKAQSFQSEEMAFVDSLEEIFTSKVHDTIKINFLLENISSEWGLYKDTTQQIVLSYLSEGVQLASQNKAFLSSAKLCRKKGNINLYPIKKRDSIIAAFKKELFFYKKADMSISKEKAEAHLNLAGQYSTTNRSDEAIENALLALDIYKAMKDNLGIARSYSMMSFNFTNFGKSKDALDYAKQALVIYEKEKDVRGILSTYRQIAVAYGGLGQFEESLQTLDTMYEMLNTHKALFSPLGFEQQLITIYKYRATANNQLKKFEEALVAIEQIRQLSKNKQLNPMNLHIKANIYEKKGDYQQAIFILHQLLRHPDIVASNYTQYALTSLEKCFAALSQFDSAYHYRVEYDHWNYRQQKHESTLNMEKLKTEFETEEKDAMIVAQEQRLSQQRTIQYLSFGIAGILGLLFFQAFRNAQSRKRTNEALAESNKLLDIKNQQNEILLKEIHHRVKNNLQTISSLLRLQSRSIDDQNALDAVQESQNRVASMALIHQKLYQGENLACIEMRDYFETIGSSIIDSFGEKANGVELEVAMSEIELDVDTAVPIGLITNELVTNSLKYAFKENSGGKITIVMKEGKNNLIYLEIKDDGMHQSSNENEGGTGFGSLLVQLLTNQLDGQLQQSIKQGTSTIIQFPLTKKAA